MRGESGVTPPDFRVALKDSKNVSYRKTSISEHLLIMNALEKSEKSFSAGNTPPYSERFFVGPDGVHRDEQFQ